jgi:hypothetical protein
MLVTISQGTHFPERHACQVPHDSPSGSAWCQHPVAAAHPSVVHGFPSSQSRSDPEHCPVEHLSPTVHALPSSHGAVLSVLRQPVPSTHESSVQTLPSEQSGGGPPTHTLFAHVSPVVQVFPSLHGSVLAANTHPVFGSHESVVHTFLSAQSTRVGPEHTPWLHRSPVVQALPSSQVAVLFVWMQPFPGSQESSVHTFLSSHDRVPVPLQAPAAHASPVVQALPSSHFAVLFV